MSWALGLLILAVLSACLAVVCNWAMNSDPQPGVSGYLPLLIVFAVAAPCLLLLALLTWIVSVTMMVLR